MLKFRIAGLMAGMLILSAGNTAAQAETLRIAGLYPAADPDAAMIKSITFSYFSGSEGDALSAELLARLSGVTINNEQYFTIIDQGEAVRPDATLSGGVKVTSETSQTQVTKKVCTLQDYNAKCVQYQNRSVTCDRNILVFSAPVKLVKTSTKQVIYSSTSANRDTIITCPDDNYAEAKDAAITNMIQMAAKKIRTDLAPVFVEERVRLVEDNDEMAKDVDKAFKTALKLTKKNEDQACTAFRNLRAASGEHRSVLFNLALCAEKADRFAEATALYNQVKPLFPNKPFVDEGLSRVAARQRAASEWQRRKAGPVRVK